jgi:hypothetical protein
MPSVIKPTRIIASAIHPLPSKLHVHEQKHLHPSGRLLYSPTGASLASRRTGAAHNKLREAHTALGVCHHTASADFLPLYDCQAHNCDPALTATLVGSDGPQGGQSFIPKPDER